MWLFVSRGWYIANTTSRFPERCPPKAPLRGAFVLLRVPSPHMVPDRCEDIPELPLDIPWMERPTAADELPSMDGRRRG